MTTSFEKFQTGEIDTGPTRIFARWAGSGPPVLLLHGFPETHLMWRDLAPQLARHFTVVCADLRGYGSSGCPPSSADHEPYSKRAMARDMVQLMLRLGHERFAVAGHDRGGRVAYRLALDHARHVAALAVLDIVPIATAWDHADARLALGYWPWSLLAQDEPLPERVLTAAAQPVVESALGGWGSPSTAFNAHVHAAYARVLEDAAHAHAICEEYRAAATLDRRHDAADRAADRRIECPVLVLWSSGGPLDSWYAEHGGPIALWQQWAHDVRGGAVEGGHFFPEEFPARTAEALRAFFSRGAK